jgi:leucyl aminopeptidase
MDIVLKHGNIAGETADLIVVNLFQGVTQPGGATGAVDHALGGAISDLITAGDCSGKTGETTLLYTRGMLPAPRVLVVGLGDAVSFGADAARDAAATVARRARDLGVKTVATIVHGADIGGMEPERAAGVLVEGTQLGLTGSPVFLAAKGSTNPETLMIVEMDATAGHFDGGLPAASQSPAASCWRAIW